MEDCIYKVGDSKQKKKVATISFLGGILEKTKIINKEHPESLVFTEFRNRRYSYHIGSRDPSVKILNEFFLAIKECSGNEWSSRRYSTSLIKSSYGLSIFLELLPHIKKEFEYLRLDMSKENFKKVLVKISDFIKEKDQLGRPLWEKSTLTSAGTRRKAMKHFVEHYLLTIEEWRDSRNFRNILN